MLSDKTLYSPIEENVEYQNTVIHCGLKKFGVLSPGKSILGYDKYFLIKIQ